MPLAQPLIHPLPVSLRGLGALQDLMPRLGSAITVDGADPVRRLIAAVAADELDVFVGDPLSAGVRAFRIPAGAWGGGRSGDLFDPEASIRMCWLAVQAERFAASTLEARLAYCPLYYRPSRLPGWLRPPRPPSARSLREAALAIIPEWQTANPGRAMPRNEFVAELVRRTGASQREALRRWADDAPADWRRPGAKRTGVSRHPSRS